MSWVRVRAEEGGKTYYMNTDDDSTAWKLPEGFTDDMIQSYESSEGESSSEDESEAAAPATAPTTAAAAAKPCPWVRVVPEDASAKTYYMNTDDDSTSWTLPEGFDAADVKDYVSSDDEDSSEDEADAADAAAPAAAPAAAGPVPWVRVTPDDGKPYYLNQDDDSTAWKLPEGITEAMVKDYVSESESGSESDSEEESAPAAAAAAAAAANKKGSKGSSAAAAASAAPVLLRDGATRPQRMGTCMAEWVSHGDGLGEAFYVNPRTGESEMEKPDGYDCSVELQSHFVCVWNGSSWDSIADDAWFVEFTSKREEMVKKILRIKAGDEDPEEDEEELEEANEKKALAYANVSELLTVIDFTGADAQAERSAMLAGSPDRVFGRMHALLLVMRAQPSWGGWRSFIAGKLSKESTPLVPYLAAFLGPRTSADVRLMVARLLVTASGCQLETGDRDEEGGAEMSSIATELIAHLGLKSFLAHCKSGIAECLDIPCVADLEFAEDPDDAPETSKTDEDALYAWMHLFTEVHNRCDSGTLGSGDELVDEAFFLAAFAPIVADDDKVSRRVFLETCAALVSIYAHPHFRSTETNLLMRPKVRSVLQSCFGGGLLHHVNAQSYPFANAGTLENCLGTIELFFSHDDTKSFFYTSDLKLLVDIVIREVCACSFLFFSSPLHRFLSI